MHLSKAEDKCFEAMSETMKDALEKQLDNCEEMKYAPHTSTNKQGCTIEVCLSLFKWSVILLTLPQTNKDVP